MIILRVTQGLSTGGENSSASIYVYETAPKNKRAMWLSIWAVCSSGTFIASLFHFILESCMTTEQLYRWGWRLPFYCGIGLFILSFWAKKRMQVTHTFHAIQDTNNNHNNNIQQFNNILTNNRWILLQFSLASAIQHGSIYLIFVFLPTYLESNAMHGWIDKYAYLGNGITSIIVLPYSVLVGYLTDKSKYKARYFLFINTILIIISGPIIFYWISITESYIIPILLQILIGFFAANIWGSIFYWYIDSLLSNPLTRTTLFGVGYNLGASLFGGTATLIGSTLVEYFGSQTGMILTGAWFSILSLISLIVIGYVELIQKKSSYKYDTNYHLNRIANNKLHSNKPIIPLQKLTN